MRTTIWMAAAGVLALAACGKVNIPAAATSPTTPGAPAAALSPAAPQPLPSYGATSASAVSSNPDYCDTQDAITGAAEAANYGTAVETAVRAKCKVGDIIWVDFGDNIGRLCDLSRAVVTAGRGGVCYLAPPRRSY
jgi:hypothetical protein